MQPALGGGVCLDSFGLFTFPCPDAFVARLSVGPEVVVRITSSQGGAARLTVTLANGGADAEDVELKFWFEAPGFGIVSLVGSPTPVFSLPPTPAFTIVSDAAIPPELPFPGTTIGARLLHPASGDVRSESTCARAPCH